MSSIKFIVFLILSFGFSHCGNKEAPKAAEDTAETGNPIVSKQQPGNNVSYSSGSTSTMPAQGQTRYTNGDNRTSHETFLIPGLTFEISGDDIILNVEVDDSAQFTVVGSAVQNSSDTLSLTPAPTICLLISGPEAGSAFVNGDSEAASKYCWAGKTEVSEKLVKDRDSQILRLRVELKLVKETLKSYSFLNILSRVKPSQPAIAEAQDEENPVISETNTDDLSPSSTIDEAGEIVASLPEEVESAVETEEEKELVEDKFVHDLSSFVKEVESAKASVAAKSDVYNKLKTAFNAIKADVNLLNSERKQFRAEVLNPQKSKVKSCNADVKEKKKEASQSNDYLAYDQALAICAGEIDYLAVYKNTDSDYNAKIKSFKPALNSASLSAKAALQELKDAKAALKYAKANYKEAKKNASVK